MSDSSPLPGAPEKVIGHGCPANTAVDLHLDNRTVGSVVANDQGGFAASFTMPVVAIGRHRLLAACGPVTLATPIDYVSSISTGGTAGAGVVTVGAVLAFFVLLGLLFARRAHFGAPW